MAIDKIFNDANVDGIADNIFGAVNNSVSEVKQMQQRKAAENVQMVVEAFKKIETNITEKFDNVTDVIEKRVLTIKDGRDGSSGSDGRNGRDGKPGRDGVNGKQGTPGTPGKDGTDGVDGVSVTNANIDFDGSLVISLSTGQQINVGEIVPPELEKQIKVISTMSTNGAIGIKDEGSSISTGVKNINFVGATVTATASGDDVTVNVSAGTGTVTSVAATVPAFLSVAGSPITTTGTLAISLSGTALPVANGGTGLASGTSGGVLAYTATGTLASSTALAANALVVGGGAGAAPSTTTTGTGVVTALGVNTGTAGAFVVNGGALGTPSSGTLTSATGLPISTGVSGLGTGIATALAVNVGTAGAPVVNGGALGSPSSVGTMPAFTLGGTVSGGGNQINNVVIGTTTPLAGNFTTLSATGTLSGGTSGTAYSFSGSAPATSLTLDSSGNLLVGTTTPIYNAAGRGLITINGSSAAALGFTAGAADKGIILHTGTDMIMSNSVSGAITFQTNNTERARIDSSGNVGIGTSSPTRKLDVATAGTSYIRARNTTNSVNVDIFADTASGAIGTQSNHPFYFFTNNTERARIESSGALLVGTTSNPGTRKVSVVGSIASTFSDANDIQGVLSTDANTVILAATYGTTGSYKPFTIEVGGSTRIAVTTSGTVTMGAYGAGAATFSAAGVISSVSDETWKIKDGVPVDTDAMLKKLEPGYWYYNDEKKETFGSDRQLGFYAQNVNAAIGPEAAPTPETIITKNQDGSETTVTKPWGYYDRSVLAITVMSLQKALATIETLTARITALETA